MKLDKDGDLNLFTGNKVTSKCVYEALKCKLSQWVMGSLCDGWQAIIYRDC